MKNGIIVSIQGYSKDTTCELAANAIQAGAVAIRTDKPIDSSVPIIGLSKKKVPERRTEAYITPDVDSVESVSRWSDYVAIDYRKINPNLLEVSEYCLKNKIRVIADISSIEDYENIIANNLFFTYISTTISVYFLKDNFPDTELLKFLCQRHTNVIAEGNYCTRSQVKHAKSIGAVNVCIGGAISDIYKLTKRFTNVY